MESGFASCLAFTRAEEGGYVADRRDSGNWTSGHVGIGTLIGSNMGVGAPALTRWMGPGAHATSEQMRELSLSTYQSIARCSYWVPLGCGRLPDGLDLMVFDFGWNRGAGTSLDVLQECLGVHVSTASTATPVEIGNVFAGVGLMKILSGVGGADVRILQSACGVAVDGIAGPLTVRALEMHATLLECAAIMALAEAQIASYRRLVNFPIYGAGWLSRSIRRKRAALAAIRTLPVQASRHAFATS